MFADVQEGVCHLHAGTYTVSYRLEAPLVQTYDLDTPMWKLKAEPEIVEKLRDVLCSSYEEYQGYRLTDGYKRDLTDQEEQDIERMGGELAARCEEN